jgi:hypothetical protein
MAWGSVRSSHGGASGPSLCVALGRAIGRGLERQVGLAVRPVVFDRWRAR